MLLRNRDRSVAPALADLLERRPSYEVEKAGDAERCGPTLEHCLELGRIQLPHGSRRRQTELFRSNFARRLRGLLECRKLFLMGRALKVCDGRSGQPADAVSPLSQAAQEPEALDVNVGVEPLAAFAPAGGDNPIPTLPGSEDVGT